MEPYYTDSETTGATDGTKGNPFSAGNRVVLFGGWGSSIEIYSEVPANFEEIARNYLLVGFNIKFDLLHYSRSVRFHPVSIFDCQYAMYCIWRQAVAWISLDDALKYFGYPLKIDVVKTEYWEKGIDTDQVPYEILREYLEGDLIRTKQVYQAIMNYLQDKPDLLRLIMLGNEDIINTYYMERAGLPYDAATSVVEGNKLLKEIEEIDKRLDSYLSGVTTINWNSGDNVSAVLFGGIVKERYRETYTQTLKSGQVKEKSRWAEREIQLPPLMKPLKGTEVAKGGYYSVSEDNLIKALGRATKSGKEIIELLLKRAKLETVVTKYYHGLPKLMEKMRWKDNILHGQLNHAVTRTSRIASNTPNQQNIPEDLNLLIYSRYSNRKEDSRGRDLVL